MGLVRPGDIGRGDEKHREAPMSRRLDEFVNGPILQHKADDEHKDTEGPKDGDGRDLARLAVTDPKPSQKKHRQAVNRP